MATFYGTKNGNYATDFCGCYDSNGKCYCAECFYYGADHVNCQQAVDLAKIPTDLVPVKWDTDENRWVPVAD